MNQYWQNLNERDRLTLAIGTIVVIIWLIYQFMISPLLSAVENQRLILNDKKETLAWMKSINPATSNKKIIKVSSSQLPRMISNSLKKNQKLPQEPLVLQKDGGDIQINFDEVALSPLLDWLYDTHLEYQFTIKQFEAIKLDTSGMAKVQLSIQTG